jgi:hypothetical protein
LGQSHPPEKWRRTVVVVVLGQAKDGVGKGKERVADFGCFAWLEKLGGCVDGMGWWFVSVLVFVVVCFI